MTAKPASVVESPIAREPPPRIWALVPVKGLGLAKQRLASAYGSDFRGRLAAAMARDVVATLVRVRELAGVAIVTADPDMAKMATALGASVIADTEMGGHTRAVAIGASGLADRADGVLVMPADIPSVSGEEVSCLLSGHRRGRSFTIVPAHDRRGSNGIVMTPPNAVPLSFGNDSFLPHLEAARRCGIEPTIVVLDGFGRDVDEPDDLARVAPHLPPGATRRVLIEAGLLREDGSKAERLLA